MIVVDIDRCLEESFNDFEVAGCCCPTVYVQFPFSFTHYSNSVGYPVCYDNTYFLYFKWRSCFKGLSNICYLNLDCYRHISNFYSDYNRRFNLRSSLRNEIEHHYLSDHVLYTE
jgi:hypothetical protein